MNIDLVVRYRFEVTSREYNLVIKALIAFGGHGVVLADELKCRRAEHAKQIFERFAPYVVVHETDEDDKE